MPKIKNKKLIISVCVLPIIIFLGFYIAQYFQTVPESCFADTSPDGCVTYDPYCTDPNVAAVDLSWLAFTQADLDEIYPGNILTSVSYDVALGQNPDLSGASVVGVGDQTSYTWPDLEENTTYYWRVLAYYIYSGGSDRADTDIYSFVTLSCNAPNKPGIPPEYPEGETWIQCLFQGVSLPTFHWTYSHPDDYPQIAYEIRIDDDSDFSVQDPEEFTDSGGASTAYAPTPSSWSAWMSWDTDYWWIVRVQDDQNNWSVWSDANNLRTPTHAYPWSEFSWLPEDPNQGEVVVFTPDEITYPSYFWTITEGEGQYVDETGPTNVEPHITFSTLINKIKLKVTDEIPYSCESDEQEITAQLPLPEYKEVPPIIWLKKIFAGVIDFFNGFLMFANG